MWATIVYINLMVIATIFCVIGVALWTAVEQVAANPPSDSESKGCYSKAPPPIPFPFLISQAHEWLRGLGSMFVHSQCR